MHWLFGLISLAGFILAALTHSAGWMALGLLIGFLAAIATVFAFAGARIDDSARQETLSQAELDALRANLRGQGGGHAETPPS